MYQVRNTRTGAIVAKFSTREDAEAHIRSLLSLQTIGHNVGDEFTLEVDPFAGLA